MVRENLSYLTLHTETVFLVKMF